MAKGNIFLGQASGKVADLVFYRMNGEQVTRSRNRHPRNPKTNAQLYQRAIMATVTNAYKAGSALFDHSFEGYSVGAANQRQFLSLNARALRSLISSELINATPVAEQLGKVVGPGVKSPVGWQGLILSDGSYPQAVFSYEPLGEDVSSIAYTLPSAGAATTRAAYAAAAGLVAGDIYTFCGFRGVIDFDTEVFEVQGASGAGTDQYRQAFWFVRLIVKSSFVEDTTTALNTATMGDIFEVDSYSEGFDAAFTSLAYTHGVGAGDLFTDFDDVNELVTIGLIRSREDSGVRSRSTLMAGNQTTIQSGISSSWALAAWEQGAVALGNSRLILEGGGF